MSGKTTRNKGRRGETDAKNLLLDRDWIVHDLTAGLSSCDLIATDRDGKTWSVEVKNTAAITPAQKEQAKRQAMAQKLPWLLMNHIAGTSSWLVQRAGHKPEIWHKKCKAD